jgi:hypothetical protein
LTLVDVQEAAEKLGNTQKTLITSVADQVSNTMAIATTALQAQINDSHDRLKLFGLEIQRKNTQEEED